MKTEDEIKIVVDDMFKEVKFDGINYIYEDEIIGRVEPDCNCCKEIMKGRKESLERIMRCV